MNILPDTAFHGFLPVEASWLLGLGIVSGLTVCGISCLALIGPSLLSTGQGFRDGCSSALTFLLTKAATYGILGGLAAGFGRILELDHDWNTRVMGLVLIATGLSLPFISRKSCGRTCASPRRIPMMFLGVATSLQPCPQIGAVLLMASRQTTITAGIACGLSYGIGIVISPMILVAAGISGVGAAVRNQVQRATHYLQGIAAVLLVIMGTRLLV